VSTIDRSGFMIKAGALLGLISLPAWLDAGLARAANSNSAVAALVMNLTGVTEPPRRTRRAC
jgi:hypothetical protein